MMNTGPCHMHCRWLAAFLTSTHSVQFSHSVVSSSLQPRGLQHARLPCPSPTPKACSNSCALSQWRHPAISSSIFRFSSHLQSVPASGSFPMSQLFASGGQRIGASASASVDVHNTVCPIVSTKNTSRHCQMYPWNKIIPGCKPFF